MTGKAPLTVRISRRFPFPPETAFDAWLDPSAVGRWLFATPDGVMKKVEIEPHVGGGFEIDEQRGQTLARHAGAYVEIDRPRRLVFEFAAGEDGEALSPPTTVTIEIAPADGGCLLTLTHEGVWADYEGRTRAGWTMILEGLGKTLGDAS